MAWQSIQVCFQKVLAGRYKTCFSAAVLMLHGRTEKYKIKQNKKTTTKKRTIKWRRGLRGSAWCSSKVPSAEMGSGLGGCRAAVLVPDWMSWCAGLSQARTYYSVSCCQTCISNELAIRVHRPHTDITTAYGSRFPKPSFFWSRACVSVWMWWACLW